MMWLYHTKAKRLYNIPDKILSDIISNSMAKYHKK